MQQWHCNRSQQDIGDQLVTTTEPHRHMNPLMAPNCERPTQHAQNELGTCSALAALQRLANAAAQVLNQHVSEALCNAHHPGMAHALSRSHKPTHTIPCQSSLVCSIAAHAHRRTQDFLAIRNA